jgi:hypothetical protein
MMAGAPLSGAAGDKDRLDVSTLRGPLLDEYYGSSVQRQDVLRIAEEIRRRHVAKLPSDTGNLKSTARVTARRSREHRDRRYEAEYSIGGARADYIVPLEDEHHWLDETLREMGFYTGDIVHGPTGNIPLADKAPQAAFGTDPESGYERLRSLVERVQAPRRRPGSAAMERDVAELREATARVEAERGRDEAQLGRSALSSYELLKEATQERDEFLQRRPYFRD